MNQMKFKRPLTLVTLLLALTAAACDKTVTEASARPQQNSACAITTVTP
jgi:hypothetical protein